MVEPLRAYAVILAGGRGTRFWPLSRERRPKQLLPLLGRRSLLQETWRRLVPLFPRRRIYVVTSRKQARAVRRQLPALPQGNLLVEPVGRNTAAAVALAAAHIGKNERDDALLAVFPADHAIARPGVLRRAVRAALATAAAEPCAVVCGIPPTEPNTGYGYIERGRLWKWRSGVRVYRARRFTEKPERATAVRYLHSGRYFWNAGMFFWRLSTFDRLLRRYLPATARALARLQTAIGTRGYRRRLAAVYPKLKNISVDYALLEQAPDVRVVPAAMGWSDLGSWAALYDFLAGRAGENVLRGPVFARAARANLVWTKKFAAVLGVDNLVVVETPEALLVTSRARAQEVSQAVKYLEEKKRRDLL